MRKTWPDIRTYRPENKVKWVSSGEPFFKALFKIISEAKEILHFQFYILEDDDTGKETIELLIKAANRGVKVFVVVDAFGSNGLSKHQEVEMKKAGINFRRFATLVKNKFIFVGRRLHHKIVVADNKISLVGGINVADKYRGSKDELAWVDFAVIVEGDLSIQLANICNRIWHKQFDAKVRFNKKSLKKSNRIEQGVMLSRVRENDRLRGKNGISISHRQAIKTARESITIVGCYFLPSTRFRYLLRKASRRGVKINIILSGISDVPFVENGTRYLYSWMLRNKIRFYEIEHRMLHGKAVVVDDVWTTIGSYNINVLSVYNNVECNIDIIDDVFAKDFNHHLYHIMKHQSKEITKENFERTNTLWNQLMEWFSYQVLRLMGKILLFFTHKISGDEE